ncbi:MAG: HDOD domain-containing protein [Acidimicrobiia bacterium]|nr:HDOD domain-containing protein [Acidimicrobiia bacterium]
MSDADGLDPYLLEQLPTLPGTAVAFLRLCDDPHAGVAEVAKVAERDPALLARVLQVANSPFYGTREPITDVVRAGAILGLRNLKLIGVGFAIVGDLWAQSDASKTLSGLIGASALAGAGARSFSETVGTGRDEEAFTSGLLGFVGELALLRCMPDEFESLWEQSDGLPSKREQRARLGTDGATVGSVLLAKWNLPAGLRTAADARSETVERRTDATNTAFVAAAGFGTALAEALMSGEAALSKMASSARSWGLDRDELLRYWDDFRLTLRRVDHDLELGMVRDLDALIVDSKDDYLASPLHLGSDLGSAMEEIDRLRAETARLETLSVHDPLTGAHNRAGFNERLRGLLARAARADSGLAVGLVLFDLDHFKQVNDSHGHPAGDRLLVQVAHDASKAVRTEELFARVGGDEFALVLEPNSQEELRAAGERIRLAIMHAMSKVVEAQDLGVSGGAAMLTPAEVQSVSTAETDLVKLADDALYAAKRTGRNQLRLSGEPEEIIVAA